MSNQTISFEIEVLGKSETVKRIAAVETSLRNVTHERKELTKAYEGGLIAEDKYQEQLTELVAKQKVLSTERSGLNRQLKTEQQQLKVNEGSMAALRLETVKLAKKVNEFAVGINGTEQELEQLKKQLATNRKAIIDHDQSLNDGRTNVGRYKQSLMGLGTTFQNVAGIIGVGLGLDAIRNGMVEVFNISKDFEAQVSKSFSLLTDVTEAQKQALRDLAIEQGKTTEFTAEESAQAIEFLAMAGYNADQIMSALPATLQLASAGSLELGRAADIASNILSGFRLEAEETQRVVDTSAFVTANFNTNMEELGEAMKYLAPISAALKVPIEEASTVVGALANNGLKGGEATRSLTSAFGRLAKPTRKMREAMKALNVDFFDSNGNFVGIADTIGILENRFEGMTDKQKIANIQTIFGAEATKQITALLGFQKEAMIDGERVTLQGAEALRFFTKEAEGASGAAATMSEARLDNLQGDLLKLRSAIEGAAIEFMQASQGGMREFVQFLTRAVPVLADNVGLITKITALLALYIARQKIANKMTLATTLAQKGYAVATQLLRGQLMITTTAQKALNTAMKTNPIGLIVTIIGGLVVILTELYQRNERVRKGFNAVGKVLRSIGNVFREIRVGVWELAKTYLLFIGEILKSNPRLRVAIEKMQGFFSRAGVFIQKILTNIVPFTAGLSAAFNQMAENIKNAFASLRLRGEIAIKQLERLKKLASFDKKGAEAVKAEIEALKKQQSNLKQIAKERKTLAKAFSEGFNNAKIGAFFVEPSTPSKTDSKTDNNVIDDANLDIPTFDDSKDRADAQKKAAEEKLRQEQELRSELQRLQRQAIQEEIRLIEDGLERETKLRIEQAEQEIEDLQARKIVKKNLTEEEQAFNDAIDASIKIKRESLQKDLINIESEYRKKSEEEAQKAAEEAKKQAESTTDYKIKAIEDGAKKERSILEATITDTKDLEDAKRQLAIETTRKKLELLKQEALASDGITQAQLNQIKLLAQELNTLSQPEDNGSGFDGLLAEAFGLDGENLALFKDTVGTVSSDVYSFLKQQSDQRRANELSASLEAAEKNKDIRLAALEREKEQGLVTEQEYEQRKAGIELSAQRRKTEAERKAFEREKAVQKRRVLIEQAIGAIKAVVSSLGNPIAIAFKLAAIAVQSGLSIMAINSQKFPKGERGMFLKDGKRHSKGGEIVELEQGEAVLNRKIMSSDEVFALTGTPIQIADALNAYKNQGVSFLNNNRLTPRPAVMARGGFGARMPKMPAQTRTVTMTNGNQPSGITKEDFANFANALIQKVNDQKVAVPVREVNRINDKLNNTKNASIWNQ